MSKTNEARSPLAAIKAAALSAVPSLANLPSELMAEGKRQLSRGAMEIASALFSGSGYVQYGPGQSITEPTRDTPDPAAPEVVQEHENAGHER